MSDAIYAEFTHVEFLSKLVAWILKLCIHPLRNSKYNTEHQKLGTEINKNNTHKNIMSVRVVDSRRSSHYTNEGERLVRCAGRRGVTLTADGWGAGGRRGAPTSGVRPAGSAVIERGAQRCSRLLATHVH